MPTLIIDACCMINVLATGRELALAEALDLTLLMSARAHSEALYLSSPPDDEGVRRRELASTAGLRACGRLALRALDGDEFVNAFVDCAARLRDADASCVAFAGVSRLPLVTDDAKERKVARSLFPQIELVSTLDLVHDAIMALKMPEPEVFQLVHDLRWRGNFAPPKRDARAGWYVDLLRQAGVPLP